MEGGEGMNYGKRRNKKKRNYQPLVKPEGINSDDVMRLFSVFRPIVPQNITVSVAFGNPKAVRAFRKVARVLADVAEDFGYREDVKDAVKAARYAAKHLTCRVDK
jgi:hypothetical protein